MCASDERVGAQPACLSAVTSNYTPRVNYAGVFASFLIYNTAPPSLALDLALRRRIICAPINIKLHQPVRVIAALAYFFMLATFPAAAE